MFELSLQDPLYPESLKNSSGAPKKLWGLGNPELLQKKSRIAIVGSRAATSYGKEVAFSLARSLAERGVVVVSGLALGIDTAAHQGALAAQGTTFAVLGCGIRYPYPKENLDLKDRISSEGIVLTEFDLDQEPSPWNFPKRNRIISALSSAIVVVEAAEKSGALVTAEWALQQGREVFAVPGNITSRLSVGCNRLIQQGASPLLDVEDIFQQLSLSVEGLEKKVEAPLNNEEEKVLQILSSGRRSVDEVVEGTGLQAAKVSALLISLEMGGRVRSLAGGFFERCHV